MKILMTSWPGSWSNKNPFDFSDQSRIGGAEIQIKSLAEALSNHAEVAYANLGTTNDYFRQVRLFSSKRPRVRQQIISAYRDLLLHTVSKFQPNVILSYLLYPVSDFVASSLGNEIGEDVLMGSIVGSWEWKMIAHSPDSYCPIPRTMLGRAIKQNDFFFTRGCLLNIAIKKRSTAPCYNLRPIVDIPEKVIVSKSDTIFSFGRLASPKRFDLIIEAFRKAIGKKILENGTKLLIAGEGSLRKHYEKMVTLYPAAIRKNIRFLGALSRNEIFKNLINSRISIHASDSEGYGTAPIESLLCNIPTVVAGYPAVNIDLKGTPGVFACEPYLSDMLTALGRAWLCPKCDSIELIKMYRSDNIGRYAYNVMSKLSIS